MLYDIGFFIFSIFYLPILIFKGKLHKNFMERFGIFDNATRASLDSKSEKIWIEAVSVGEVALCRTLIPLLQEKYPDREIVLSTITRAGNDLAKKSFKEGVIVIYFPLDFSFVVKKVVQAVRPKLFIMIETEIWPNLLTELWRKKVPSVMINGRVSDKSFGKYRIVKPFLKNILEKVNLFCMRSSTDAVRIIEMGAPKGRVKVTGNMKFDIKLNPKPNDERNILELLGLKTEDQILVAGSTHKGEDEDILTVFKELIKAFAGLNLLIAPRHIDRVESIEALIRSTGFEPLRVSRLRTHATRPAPSTVFVLDTIGQLNDIYAIATIVFVGGSLVRYGGHNPIEPAVFEKPILFGPHMFNFKDTAMAFLLNKAAIQVTDKRDLFDKCVLLLKDEKERSWLGKNARRVVFENRGATERNLQAIEEVYQ